MEFEKKYRQPADGISRAAFCVCLLAVFLVQNILAQQTYTSRVEGWTGEKADLILPLENPVVIGAIDENGQLQMTLSAALADQISQARQKANDASENLKFRNRTVRNAFYYTHDYDIDLHEGWNMVMTEVTDVYTDQEGRVLPLKYRMKTVDAIPESHAFFLVD